MLTAAASGMMLAVLVAAAATRFLAGFLRKRGVIDKPNARSSHNVPTPRGGGVGIIMGTLAGTLLQAWIWEMPLPPAAVWVGLGGIALTGLLDDVLGLRADARLGLQAVFAAIVVASGLSLSKLPLPAPLDISLNPASGWLFSMLWIMGVTNIYNFLDGIDGYAAVQGMIACAAIVVFQISPLMGPLLLAAGGACAGFIFYNWHPAKIFMGDTGSTGLGFLLAVSPLQAAVEVRHLAVFVTALFLWFFLADGVYTLTRRAIKGEKFWRPHRTHLYQLLASGGLRHSHVVCRVGFAMLLLAAAAGAAHRWGVPEALWAPFALAVAGFLAYRHTAEMTGIKRQTTTGWK